MIASLTNQDTGVEGIGAGKGFFLVWGWWQHNAINWARSEQKKSESYLSPDLMMIISAFAAGCWGREDLSTWYCTKVTFRSYRSIFDWSGSWASWNEVNKLAVIILRSWECNNYVIRMVKFIVVVCSTTSPNVFVKLQKEKKTKF